jgi:hypothetical protein
LEVIAPFFFLSVKVILKFPSPSVNPANQALLSTGDKSKPKGFILVPLKLLYQSIARCNASILGVPKATKRFKEDIIYRTIYRLINLLLLYKQESRLTKPKNPEKAD